MSKLARLAGITQPTLVANGSNDITVPTVNSYLLAGHLPDAKLIIYPAPVTASSSSTRTSSQPKSTTALFFRSNHAHHPDR
jgi:hypothetical protein